MSGMMLTPEAEEKFRTIGGNFDSPDAYAICNALEGVAIEIANHRNVVAQTKARLEIAATLVEIANTELFLSVPGQNFRRALLSRAALLTGIQP